MDNQLITISVDDYNKLQDKIARLEHLLKVEKQYSANLAKIALGEEVDLTKHP